MDNNDVNINNDDTRGEWSILDRPYAYVIFPLIVVFICIFVAVILYNRRRRQRLAALHGHNWPGGREAGGHYHYNLRMPGGRAAGVGRRGRHGGRERWANWGAAARSQEGLNELGEAPPPYDGKRDNRDGGAPPAGEELRDLERGEGTVAAAGRTDADAANRPPEYISEPGPALTRPVYR